MLCIIRETQIKKTMSCYRISVEKDENLEHWPYWMLARMWNNGQSRLLLVVVVIQSLSRVWLCDPMDCSTPGLPVHHQLPELAQTHVHCVCDAIQPSHLLSSPSPPAFRLSQHQGLFKWVSSSHQVAKELDFQLQHQSIQWIFRTDFL